MFRKTLVLSVMLAASSCVAEIEFSDIVKWRLAREELPAQVRHPFFIIPLDGWSDFDLMADTNNFSVSGGTNSLYWFNSVGPSSCSNFYKFARADLHAQLYYCKPDVAGVAVAGTYEAHFSFSDSTRLGGAHPPDMVVPKTGVNVVTNDFIFNYAPVSGVASVVHLGGDGMTASPPYPATMTNQGGASGTGTVVSVELVRPGVYEASSWLLASNTVSLTAQIGGNGNYQNTVILIPSLTVKDGSTNTWMYPANDRLVWSYHRHDAVSEETNSLGKLVWHPIMPVQWRAAPMDVHF